MSDVEIVHPVPAEEIRGWLASLSTTFLDSPESEKFDRYVQFYEREWQVIRSWGARARGRWVGSLATEPRRITVPAAGGGTADLGVNALTAVTVNATHRRRGLLTGMLDAALRDAADRGEPVSVLIAAEWPIYGRFGYAPATLDANYSYFPRRSAVAAHDSGQVRQVDAAELAEVAPAVFDRARRARPGQMDRDGEWWPRRLAQQGYQPVWPGKAPHYYLHESDAGPDGLLLWSPERDFDIEGNLGSVSVKDLIAADDIAYRNLWAYLGGIDVIDEVVLHGRPVDEPVRWLLANGRALRQTYTGDAVWLRILDVPLALGARGYAAAGRLVLDVRDEDRGGYAAGRFLLEVDEDGRGVCAATSAEPDLVLSQRALASAYLGGFRPSQFAIGGLVEEVSAGALRRADAVFAATATPWNATGF